MVIIFVFFANLVFAIHQEPEEFPLIPEITCTYNETYWLLEFNITNALGRPLHLDRAPVLDATTKNLIGHFGRKVSNVLRLHILIKVVNIEKILDLIVLIIQKNSQMISELKTSFFNNP